MLFKSDNDAREEIFFICPFYRRDLGSLPWDWHLEEPLEPGRQFDVVYESPQKMQSKFIVWL